MNNVIVQTCPALYEIYQHTDLLRRKKLYKLVFSKLNISSIDSKPQMCVCLYIYREREREREIDYCENICILVDMQTS
jgi:hypothetical protein